MAPQDAANESNLCKATGGRPGVSVRPTSRVGKDGRNLIVSKYKLAEAQARIEVKFCLS